MTQKEKLNRRLQDAAESGQLDKVRDLIAAGAQIDIADENGMQALHIAVYRSRLSVVKFLLEKGARIDAVDDEGWTPLHYVDHLPVAEFLLEAGADPAAVNKDGKMPVNVADDPEVLVLLKKWSEPEFLEKRRQEANVKVIREHWKRMGRFTPSCPRI